ncbi:MAG: hypothetical protein B7Z62_00320 [Deltaproteobacteria bacterium 37-65-8]|nr:MAG: hypothetical protein B7Z62_00320 [Deltaproteobacteria bacterium 37-65-8]
MGVEHGGVLYRGSVSWTANEDAVKTLDVPLLGLGDEDQYEVSIRNGSAVVDVTVDVGYMAPVYASDTSPRGAVACTTVDVGDKVTCVGHGLVVGDAIVFGTVAGGVVVGTVYYVVAVIDADNFQFATARGAAAFTVDITAGANTFTIASEFFVLTSLLVPKFVAASTTASVAGLVSRIISGWPFGPTGGRLSFMKSAATAAIFGCVVEIRRL